MDAVVSHVARNFLKDPSDQPFIKFIGKAGKTLIHAEFSEVQMNFISFFDKINLTDLGTVITAELAYRIETNVKIKNLIQTKILSKLNSRLIGRQTMIFLFHIREILSILESNDTNIQKITVDLFIMLDAWRSMVYVLKEHRAPPTKDNFEAWKLSERELILKYEEGKFYTNK